VGAQPLIPALLGQKADAALYDVVDTKSSTAGYADDGTDAAGLFNAEFFAPLKPAGEWPGTHDKEELTGQLLKQLQDKFPGVEFNFSQYLQDNVSEAVSGVKGENSIKLYGNDLQALTDTANKIKSVLATIVSTRAVSSRAMMLARWIVIPMATATTTRMRSAVTPNNFQTSGKRARSG